MEKMQAEYDAMAVQKTKLKKTYQVAEKEAAEADMQLKNIRQYIGIEKENQERTMSDRKHEISI